MKDTRTYPTTPPGYYSGSEPPSRGQSPPSTIAYPPHTLVKEDHRQANRDILEEYRQKKDGILTNFAARKKQNKEEYPQRSFGEYRRHKNYPDRYKSQYDPRLDSAIPYLRDYYNGKHLKPISVALAGQ